MIKVYVHFRNLQSFKDGEWINAKMQFIGQDDIELYVNLKDVKLAYQQRGFTIRKKKWYEKLMLWKK